MKFSLLSLYTIDKHFCVNNVVRKPVYLSVSMFFVIFVNCHLHNHGKPRNLIQGICFVVINMSGKKKLLMVYEMRRRKTKDKKLIVLNLSK